MSRLRIRLCLDMTDDEKCSCSVEMVFEEKTV
jgi:hypothetical protein